MFIPVRREGGGLDGWVFISMIGVDAWRERVFISVRREYAAWMFGRRGCSYL